MRQRFKCLCVFQCCLNIHDEFEQKFNGNSTPETSPSSDNSSVVCFFKKYFFQKLGLGSSSKNFLMLY